MVWARALHQKVRRWPRAKSGDGATSWLAEREREGDALDTGRRPHVERSDLSTKLVFLLGPASVVVWVDVQA